jgi:hypothetical protein
VIVVRQSGFKWMVFLLALGAASGCTTGEGEGWVRSDRLYIEDCWNGPFDLQPTFFGANPYRQEQLLIRIQRGDNLEEVSDGLTVLVSDVAGIRENDIDRALPVGLPPGVTPTGVPVAEPTGSGDDPARVSLALYLHASCHAQNGTIYAIDGTITFASLFSGDPNEPDGADRLTDADFEARFADPRDMGGDGSIDPDRVSLVRGHFRFFFQRGQPAQPFP